MGGQRRGIERKIGMGLAVGVVWLGLCGCGPSALEMDYGRSVRNNIAQQVINPQAGLAPTPTVGLDPQAGHNVLERYDKSFKEKETTPAAIPTVTTTATK
ncbi:MAG: hypothetical protein Q8M54_11325 [Desulfobaccales bacterium]|nr:hypothetical protein [Desulfobaccales bacterium]